MAAAPAQATGESQLGSFGPVRFPVYAPSKHFERPPREVMTAPALSRVHGFNAACCRPLVFLSERRCAFAAGKLVVALDVDRGEQGFVVGHSDAVSCLAHSEEQAFGASGQVRLAGAKYAEVLLWDSQTLQVRGSFSLHKANVEAIGFIQGGEVLVTIGDDRDRTMALWPSARDGYFRSGRKQGAPLAICSAYKGGAVNGVLAAPYGPDQPVHFITFGVQHVKFWESSRLAPSVDGRRGAFGSEGVPKQVVCAAWVARDRLVVGGSAGEIFFFEGSRAIRRVQFQSCAIAHLQPQTDALAVVHANGACCLLASGQMIQWDIADLNGAPEPRMQTPLAAGQSLYGSSLILASKTHLMLMDISKGMQNAQNCKVLLSQPSEPLAAICAHPVEPRIYTGALDGGVRCYRNGDLRPIESASFKVSSGVTCLAVSGVAPDSEGSAWLAVGCVDSTLSIMSETTFHYVLRRTLSNRGAKLTCARFSATDVSGAHPLWLAVGTDDGCIHTFRFKDATCKSSVHTGEEICTKVATLRGHEAPIYDVCFADTLPCTHLISVDASGKELAFDVPMARRLPTVALVRDVPFSPWTAPIGWQVQGCWAGYAPSPKAALPHRRFFELPGRQAIAVTDSSGMSLEMYPFPCPEATKSPPPRLEGPGAEISGLLFSIYSDNLLATSGTVIFSWSWPQEGRQRQKEVERGLAASPLRPVQGSVIFDTPDGQKRALAASPKLVESRQRPRSAAGRLVKEKENAALGATEPAGKALEVSKRSQSRDKIAEKQDLQTPPPKRASVEPPASQMMRTPPPAKKAAPNPPTVQSQPRRAWEEGAASPASPSKACERVQSPEAKSVQRASSNTAAAGSELAKSGDTRQWIIEAKAPAGLPSRARKSSDMLACKIGAAHEQERSSGEVASDTRRLHEDNEARSRSIQERHNFDSVGFLLSGKAQPNVAGVDRLEDRYQESRAGKFQYRARETDDCFEVEALLPGGKLTRVTRNPLRRTLCFEGKALYGLASSLGPIPAEDEHLVVRVPPGFDIVSAPAEVVKDFEQGSCFVALNRNGSGGRSDRRGAGVPSAEVSDL
mmetsp:Transcript_85149/g.150629  ORF Transcript_85149/g.150629 Transcript_85149/m.150629 type:complete len:1073 (+) Transcript_85149:35-3253(+)|eukprot:CAMPEP_0197631550 /NCGR_PEP_ID=MMETSP1338-20131121/8674_1 /TAXON_ID=43686 ORGANISM="Pelagodinium beii, Strain RCC1491" /NCGR_SAMPLE_ID=MMETSP1338 /ASSEMBLY_ACC=CAM_ASM_000754 /LENGTH=1072 /DNA_ID=CAMNT_0043203029 /DNA_START=35 /DNA_END=3253 /DNA_ORIENTATION=+